MFILDRLEEEWAVIEFADKTFTVPFALLPKEAKEGDILTIAITIDEKATRKRQAEIDKKAQEIFENLED